MADEFDLEQGIMTCWNVTSELGLLLEELMENQLFSRDDAANFVLGLQRIYESKFDKLFREFESFSSEYRRLRTELDNTRDELFRQREIAIELEEANIAAAEAAAQDLHGKTLEELLTEDHDPEPELVAPVEIWWVWDEDLELIEDEWAPLK